jgi:stearoyl-CoA desaturase (delta-9 desaturase)
MAPIYFSKHVYTQAMAIHPSYGFLCLAVFLAAYLLNIFYISVLYHRGLAHGAVKLAPLTRELVIHTGSWITGIDPKAWVCMHRLHHRHSDTDRDPHSPWNQGVFGVMRGQLRSYEKTLRNLKYERAETIRVVQDLDFSISWLNRKKLWWLPYAVHAAVGILIAVVFHAALLGAAYWIGMMSHPIQGWMVNALAHRFGYRNFGTPDESRNNTLIAWLVMGEGYQNNHHAAPTSAKFSARWFEFDGGYWLCLLAQAMGALKIQELSVSERAEVAATGLRRALPLNSVKVPTVKSASV